MPATALPSPIDLSTHFHFGGFPVDIVREIISHVRSKTDLLNICLVCKVFNTWARPQLYESPFLSNPRRIACFSTTLVNNPELGCKVRDLCIFTKKWPYKVTPPEPPDRDSDDTSSDWMPDDADSDSSSDFSDQEDPGSDPESKPGASEVDGGMQDDDFPETELTRSVSIDTRSPTSSDFDLVKDVFAPYVNSESLLLGHACAILERCPSLRSLYTLPFSRPSATYLHALPPYAPLTELAIYLPLELEFHASSSRRTPILALQDPSSVRRLTMFCIDILTLEKLYIAFPALTHLRTPVLFEEFFLIGFAGLANLTHLWLLPRQRRIDLPQLVSFAQGLRAHCPKIERVQIEFYAPGDGGEGEPAAADFAALETEFPFLKVKTTTFPCAPRRLWILPDPRYRIRTKPMPFLNGYTRHIHRYWIERGGWDD